MLMLDILFRTIASFAALQVLTKIIGARQISQLSYYDYIVGITIGSIAATASIDTDISFAACLFAIVLYFALTWVLSWVTSKSLFMRRVFTGTPLILIHHGKLIEPNMKKNRLDVNDILTQCRTQGYFCIDDIDFAIMETNGNISILPKAGKRPLTPEDMKLQVDHATLYANVIIDGRIMPEQLKSIGKDEQWLHTVCRQHNIRHIDSILLAVADADNHFYVYPKDESLNQQNFFI